MAKEFFTSESFFELEEENIVADLVQNVQKTIDYLTEFVEKVDFDEYIRKTAHLDAINYISSIAYELLKLRFLEAHYKSVEYNHELFINQATQALLLNKNDLIRIESNEPGKIEVIVNMHYLGDLDEYAAAVDAAREELKISRIRNPIVRSVIWAEKIYGVDREDNVIEKETPEGTEDITYRYKGLWTDTIKMRLSFIDFNHAPWWYILEYGNLNLVFPDSKGGIPYPKIEPTFFLQNFISTIEQIFQDYYRSVIDNVENFIRENLTQDLRFTPSTSELLDIIEEWATKKVDTLHEAAFTETHKTIDVVVHDGKAWELYVTSKGNIGRRYSLKFNKGLSSRG